MSMRIVIQCAAAKRLDGFLRTPDGRPVKFVAHPELAPASADFVFARPEDAVEPGARSWRDLVLDLNRKHERSETILPAFQLYTPPSYGALVKRFGLSNIFILSAGWGLLPSTFLTPNYDITFSASVDAYKRRRQTDIYRDFEELNGEDPVLFLGGKDYLPLFCALTARLKAPRFVYFNSTSEPDVPGCHIVKYSTTRRTNWHYSCADELIAGTLPLPSSGQFRVLAPSASVLR